MPYKTACPQCGANELYISYMKVECRIPLYDIGFDIENTTEFRTSDEFVACAKCNYTCSLASLGET